MTPFMYHYLLLTDGHQSFGYMTRMALTNVPDNKDNVKYGHVKCETVDTDYTSAVNATMCNFLN